MDHLELPRHPTRPLPSVRIYTKVEYDGGPFLDYLDRIGWTERELVTWFSPRTSDEIHAVLQTWTYFGLLSAVLGRTVSTSQFTERGMEGGAMLTTKNLRPMVYEWVERETRLPKSRRLADEDHTRLCFERVWRVYDALGMRPAAAGHHKALDSGFCLSVQLLCEFLISTHKYAFHPPGLELPRYTDIVIHLRSISFATHQLFSDMHAAGWCPSETHSMRKLSPSEQCLAYCLDRPGPDKNHEACSGQKCLAYQISEDVYQTRHTTTGCTCEYVYCSQTRLAEILLSDAGSIPLISQSEPTRGPDGRLWVDILDSKGNTGGRSGPRHQQQQHMKFVAISHVWSDGLGNNRDNGIPRCQFRRLLSLVAGLYRSNVGLEPVPFWFDTLCFPLAPPDAGDAALIRMRESYEDADQVLVLDGYLLSADSAGMSDNELLVRIFCSPWNRRLWTLQEGVLPRTLVFRFANSYVSSRYFTEKFSHDEMALRQGRPTTRSDLSKEPVPTLSWKALMDIRERESGALDVKFSPAVMQETLRLFPHHVARLLSLDLQHHYRLSVFILISAWSLLSWTYHRIISGSTRETILSRTAAPMTLDGAKGALTYRNTSVKADEPLCLGNLLGVDPAVVVRAQSREARMTAIWRSVFSRGNGHAMLLFAEGPRLATEGFKWAPATLMDGRPLEFWGGVAPSLQSAVEVPTGLLTSMPAVLIQAARLAVGAKFEFSTSWRNRRNNYLVEWSDHPQPNLADLLRNAMAQRAADTEEAPRDATDKKAQTERQTGDEIVSSSGFFVILTMTPIEMNGVPSFHTGLRRLWLADLVKVDRVRGLRGLNTLRLISRVGIERYSDNSQVFWTPDELRKADELNPGTMGLIRKPFSGTVTAQSKWLID